MGINRLGTDAWKNRNTGDRVQARALLRAAGIMPAKFVPGSRGSRNTRWDIAEWPPMEQAAWWFLETVCYEPTIRWRSTGATPWAVEYPESETRRADGSMFRATESWIPGAFGQLMTGEDWPDRIAALKAAETLQRTGARRLFEELYRPKRQACPTDESPPVFRSTIASRRRSASSSR